MDAGHNKASTSALAKQLGLSSQQLFSTLKDYGWLRKTDDGWVLTAKGEFEGGEYVHSKRYGRYVVWPPEIVDHPLLQAVEDHRTISATAIGKSYRLNAREVNRLLAELGWIKHSMQGWELTALGEQQGGNQLENEHSGTFYVSWPDTVLDNDILRRQLQAMASSDTDTAIGDDLFATVAESYQGLDGHSHTTALELAVCQWLYLAGIAHACQRQLPISEPCHADFYLPAHQLYIECWGNDQDGSLLAEKMQRKSLYTEYGLSVIDVEEDDLLRLDDVLTRQMRKFGVRVY